MAPVGGTSGGPTNGTSAPYQVALAAVAGWLLLGVWILELRESGWPDVWLAAAC
jgi:hypothetical protein